MLTEKFQAPETAQQIAGSNWAPLGSYTWSSAALTSLLFRPHPSESEPENHEQHWFWIGLNRRDPREGHSWRWSDGLGVRSCGGGRMGRWVGLGWVGTLWGIAGPDMGRAFVGRLKVIGLCAGSSPGLAVLSSA